MAKTRPTISPAEGIQVPLLGVLLEGLSLGVLLGTDEREPGRGIVD